MKDHDHDLLQYPFSSNSSYFTISFAFQFSNAMDDITNAVGITSNVKLDSDIFALKVSNLPGIGGQPTLFVSEEAVPLGNLEMFKW